MALTIPRYKGFKMGPTNKTYNFYFKSDFDSYVSLHFGGETYCFCPVRLSVTQFVSATPLKLLNRIS